MQVNPNQIAPSSGRIVAEDGSTINVADLLRNGLRLEGSNIKHSEAVTPQDATDLPGVATYGAARSLYVGVTGTVVIRKEDGSTQTFENFAPGFYQAMPPYVGIEATGTTAANLNAGY